MIRNQTTGSCLAFLALALSLSLLSGQSAQAQVAGLSPDFQIYPGFGRTLDTRSISDDFSTVNRLAGGLVTSIDDLHRVPDPHSVPEAIASALLFAAPQSPLDWILEDKMPGIVAIPQGPLSHGLIGVTTARALADGSSSLLKSLTLGASSSLVFAAIPLHR